LVAAYHVQRLASCLLRRRLRRRLRGWLATDHVQRVARWLLRRRLQRGLRRRGQQHQRQRRALRLPRRQCPLARVPAVWLRAIPASSVPSSISPDLGRHVWSSQWEDYPGGPISRRAVCTGRHRPSKLSWPKGRYGIRCWITHDPNGTIGCLEKDRVTTDGKAVPCRMEIHHRTRPKSLENGIKHATRPRIERQLAKQG